MISAGHLIEVLTERLVNLWRRGFSWAYHSLLSRGAVYTSHRWELISFGFSTSRGSVAPARGPKIG